MNLGSQKIKKHHLWVLSYVLVIIISWLPTYAKMIETSGQNIPHIRSYSTAPSVGTICILSMMINKAHGVALEMFTEKKNQNNLYQCVYELENFLTEHPETNSVSLLKFVHLLKKLLDEAQASAITVSEQDIENAYKNIEQELSSLI